MASQKSSSQQLIKLALPKKGRLREPAIKLLQKAGYPLHSAPHTLHSECPQEGFEFFFLRTEDIPTLVNEGAIDLGITGKNNVLEKRATLHEVLPLAYGACRLCLAGPKRRPPPLASLQNKKIATSFPALTQRFFSKARVRVQTIPLSGSLEIMIKLQLCDAIVDIVETGTTLADHALHVYTTIGHYYTALYANPARSNVPVVQLLKKRLQGVLLAQNYRILEYNINKNLLKQAEALSSGFDSPTISQLDHPNMVAVKILVKRSEVVTLMDKLEQLGASGIFETELKNARL